MKNLIPQKWNVPDDDLHDIAARTDFAGQLDWSWVGRWNHGMRLDVVAREWSEGETYEWVMWYLRPDGTVGVMTPVWDVEPDGKATGCEPVDEGSTPSTPPR